MCARQVKQQKPEPPTTGHEWDGIREFDNPMPRWWLWTFYACILWGIGYTIAYPAWPLISGASRGIIGHDSRADLAAELEGWNEANAAIKAQLTGAELSQIGADPQLASFAENAGAAVFRTHCAQCHGAGAAGVQELGYPNLLDDDWLWGGDIAAIYTTISHGIRSSSDPDSRYSEMPKFGADGLLDKAQIGEVVEYVLQISGQDHDPLLAQNGATIFAENCSACHGERGEGDRSQGAPQLSDAVWLYGGSREAISKSVTLARFGVMPPWADRLSEDEIRAVSFYVHSLGGGE